MGLHGLRVRALLLAGVVVGVLGLVSVGAGASAKPARGVTAPATAAGPPGGSHRNGLVSSGVKRTALPFVRSVRPIVERRGLKGPRSALPAPKGKLVRGKTTAYSRTYASPTGGFVTRIYSQPVNYRDSSGRWQAINNLLRADGNTVRNVANSFSLSLPAQLGGAPVRLSAGGSMVAFSPLGAAGMGVISGNAERFANAYHGVAVTYANEPNGVKELIAIRSRSAPTRFVYRLQTSSGLKARKVRDGGIVFVDAKGHVRFLIPPAFMYDGENAPAKRSVDLLIQRTARGEQLTVSANRAWVESHLAYGPVVIDPSLNQIASPDCWLSSSSPTTSLCGGTRLDVGQSGSNQANSLLQFDTSTIPQGSVVLNAQVGLYLYGETTSNPQSVGLYRATSTWTSGANWNTKDGSVDWTSPGGDYTMANGVVNSSTGGTSGWNYWYPTRMAADWVSGSQPNDGVILTDTAGTSATNDMSFYSHNYSDCNYVPFLQVEYDPRAGYGPGYQFDTQQLTDRSRMSVNVANGNMLLNSTDLNVTGTNGFDGTLSRYYNSIWDSTYQGETGHGSTFSLGLDAWLHTFGNGDVAMYPGDGSAYLYVRNSDGSYQTPVGANADLTSNGTQYTLAWRRTGQRWLFPTGTYSLASEIQNRQGNKIDETYSTDGIDSFKDTQGRTVTLGHQSSPAPGQTWSFVSGFQDASGRSGSYGYSTSPSNLLVSYRDPSGNTTHYGWDSRSHLNQVTTPAGNVTNVTYDAQGRVASIVRTTNSAHTTGPTTTFAYSTGGGTGSPCSATQKQTVVTDPDYAGSMPAAPRTAHTTTYCANLQDQIQSVWDGAGNQRQTSYTPNGDIASYQTPGGSTASLGYDSTTSNLTSIQTGGSSGPKTTFGYTDSNHPFLPNSTQDPQLNSTSATYNNNPNNARSTSPPDGTLASEANGPSGSQIRASFGYNNADGSVNQGVPTSSTDANRNTTSYTASGGNITQTTPPSGAGLGSERVTYDSLSRPCAIQDGGGAVAHYIYDNLDRVIQIDYYNDGTVDASTCAVTSSNHFSTVKYTYDNDGNPISLTDSYGTTSYTYDALNRLVSQDPPGQPTEQYGYDNAGNLTSLADNGGTVTYTYNGINELSGLTDPTSATPTTFTYNADGRRTSVNYPNGASVAYSYATDNTGRLESVTDKGHSGTVLRSFTYSYQTSASNPACPANTTGNSSLKQSVTDQAGNVTWYCNDQLNRLTEAETLTSQGTQTADYKYQYDANGNITRKTVNGTTSNYSYNSGNQATGAGWSYVLTGNENTAPSGLGLWYNPINQTTNIDNVSRGYFGTDQTQPAWAGASINIETSILGLSTRSNDSWATHNNFTRDNNGNLIDERTTSGNYYYMLDGLGSVVGLTDASGNQANSYTYDPYGNATSSTGNAPNYFGFDGGYTTDGGLVQFGQRYYDPNYGRWTQQDPINQMADLLQADRYAYAGDNPVNLSDASGLRYAESYYGPCYNVSGALESYQCRSDYNNGVGHYSLLAQECVTAGYERSASGVAACATTAIIDRLRESGRAMEDIGGMEVPSLR